ncbi:MAG: hypothetical protein IPJ48_16190 [Propionivibrio sp.]|uniref:Uncharacterized protein n=1 Tax=Candidatus Propionivibrio dominans TaxID=2954373 RepID=A0A9D7IHR6_9RHOO|nr:hypothetical protein [Candidatus Propionivibrio dominans]
MFYTLAEFALKLTRANKVDAEGDDGFFKLLFDLEYFLARYVGIDPEVEIGVPSIVAPEREPKIYTGAPAGSAPRRTFRMISSDALRSSDRVMGGGQSANRGDQFSVYVPLQIHPKNAVERNPSVASPHPNPPTGKRGFAPFALREKKGRG